MNINEMDNTLSALTGKCAGYRFACTMCGDCCTGDVAIRLNLFDLYKLSRFMHYRHSHELISAKLIKMVRGENDVPAFRMFFKVRPFRYCPFLENRLQESGTPAGRCRLHPRFKPLVCKLAPAGRIVDLRRRQQVSYTVTPPAQDCPGFGSGPGIRIEDIRRHLQEELDWEVRYFHLLDFLIDMDPARQDKYSRQLHTFCITGDFNAIISKQERIFAGLVNSGHVTGPDIL